MQNFSIPQTSLFELLEKYNLDPVIGTYAILLVSATVVIYCASHATLHRPDTALRADPKDPKFEPSDLEVPSSNEKLEAEDAYLMPVMGGFMLVGMYFLIKKLDKKYIEMFFNAYFALFGLFAVATTFGSLMLYKSYFTSADLLGLPIALAIVVGNWYTSNWILGNIMGASFAFSSIRFLTIDSFKTGYIMLIGLFLYDIFFVFGTDVMVTVATSLTVPIKLTAPRPATATSSRSEAMLGLGDIIVPAIFLSLCLRFDSWNYYRKHAGTPYSSARPFPKPFFNSAMVMYVVALLVTICVMHFFKAAQPALLYLCPGIGGAVVVTAFIKGEWAVLWGYKEISESDKADAKKEEEKAAKKKLLEEKRSEDEGEESASKE
ncbi:signal peptide peptidase-domain-containing protein [Myxozyma melibiosi]|uniref:Signal peptide peptidase-domain-containing protein n=1 Tax=Myxozyma melibiosi TaxID=54550 RepID=A0ABR1F981_9ASCO